MRILIFSSLLLLLGCKDEEQKTFEVEGKIKNAAVQTVYLEESALSNLQPVIVDSAKIEKDGSFELEALSKEESIYSLRLDKSMYPFATFINDTEKIEVDADFKSPDLYTIKGSPASESLKEYLKTNSTKVRNIYAINQGIDSLQKLSGNDSLVSLRQAEKESAIQDLKTYTADYINNSKSPALSLFILGSYQSIASNAQFGVEGFDQQQVNDIIAKTASKFPDHQSIAALKTKVQAEQNQQAAAPAGQSWVNKSAPDFTLPDATGKQVSLSSFKGKYVLVDFWASWCKPCRLENPNVVQAYQKFKDKNFTILGVSLDQKKEPWLEAIKQDNLAWTHVSDLKFWDSQVVGLYGFDGIPFNVLIDPAGKVIGEGLRGEDLERKLTEVLQ